MYFYATHSVKARSKQKGAALIFGLLLMLVITIIAMSGVRESLMQERMSGNWHDRNLAFQASEAALLEGQRWLDTSISNRAAAETHSRLVDPLSWNGAPNHGSVDLSEAGFSLAGDATFHIDPPMFARPDGSMDISQDAVCDRVFPVISHGIGNTDAARVTLSGSIIPSGSGLVTCPATW